MLKKVGTWVVALVVVAWALPAVAESPRRSRHAIKTVKAVKTVKRAKVAGRAAPKNEYQKVQRMSFLDDVVDAGVQRPDGVVVSGSTRQPQTSLIRVRMNFVPELIKSAENI